MQDGFREHQILKKVLVVQLPRHLEFLEVLILLKKKRVWIIVGGKTVTSITSQHNKTCAHFIVDKVKTLPLVPPAGQLSHISSFTKEQTHQGE